MSFVPFLGGKRVCVGKTFAENAFKVVLPLILKGYSDFEFVDE
jgi:cytochrome P450